ncbi:cytochrome b/b6 domain-containing protein [Microbacterium sp. WCS2018Hpa-23]|uniref:cytochrome b/b6 domain-containing protein n=1 Tax=Microbacterium sp. WCS2018Hpa-23 TaxID=3073634 RepID=UPI002882E728|nr:cytochrome b/b6 domain-containing protein [Microbacterium sp. WCS2018Hpa-23]
MATRMLRSGLPRVRGGEPWPPGVAVDEPGDESAASPSAPPSSLDERETAAPVVESAVASPVAESAVASPGIETAAPSPVVERGAQRRDETRHVASAAVTVSSVRRGLPRTSGGEPWPPAGVTPAGADGVSSRSASPSSLNEQENASAVAAAVASPVVEHASSRSASASSIEEAAASASVASAAEPTAGQAVEQTGSVRRGLPRVAGGDPWPPAGTVPQVAASTDASAAATETADVVPVIVAPSSEPAAAEVAASAPSTAVAPASASFALGDPSIPLPAPRTVWNGSAPRRITAAAPASARPRPPWTQAIAGLLGAAALGILAAAAVAFVRALLSFPFMQDFLAAFPGEYTPAIAVEPGFAPWVNWAHFFNVFLMVLIIRSGLRIRNEKRPTAFWTPRGDPKGKVSLTIWFHQALDILWLVNGVIFVVLLFVTGHWVRIVPTSWEVIPNALSAALQYVSFDWPTEHGWVNYNSLQQLAYFVTVFIAAPLAAATGFRMSGMWPKKAERLSKAYPIEWARALHFPVMIYFVVFIIGHVALVFLTGFLRNLNHMYASSDAVGWTGFWVFVASLVVIALGWVAARPLVIAPIAKLFGSVSGR